MDIDLNSIGMIQGQQYEVIVTTENIDGTYNAAPIGVICKNKDEILCKIFKTSKTLSNICKNESFTVNITYDPILFTLATIDNIPLEYYEDNTILKDINAYFKCNVSDFKETVRKDDPVRKNEAIVITAKVNSLKIKETTFKPLNRGMCSLIESLVNYTRIDYVTKEKQDYYINRLKESERIIKKVGTLKEKEAIKILKEKIISKGFNFK